VTGYVLSAVHLLTLRDMFTLLLQGRSAAPYSGCSVMSC